MFSSFFSLDLFPSLPPPPASGVKLFLVLLTMTQVVLLYTVLFKLSKNRWEYIQWQTLLSLNAELWPPLLTGLGINCMWVWSAWLLLHFFQWLDKTFKVQKDPLGEWGRRWLLPAGLSLVPGFSSFELLTRNLDIQPLTLKSIFFPPFTWGHFFHWFFRERGREREKHWCEKHRLVASPICPDWGLNL